MSQQVEMWLEDFNWPVANDIVGSIRQLWKLDENHEEMEQIAQSLDRTHDCCEFSRLLNATVRLPEKKEPTAKTKRRKLKTAYVTC